MPKATYTQTQLDEAVAAAREAGRASVLAELNDPKAALPSAVAASIAEGVREACAQVAETVGMRPEQYLKFNSAQGAGSAIAAYLRQGCTVDTLDAFAERVYETL